MKNNSRILFSIPGFLGFEVDYYDSRGPQLIELNSFNSDFITTLGISEEDYLKITEAGWRPKEREDGTVRWSCLFLNIFNFLPDYYEFTPVPVTFDNFVSFEDLDDGTSTATFTVTPAPIFHSIRGN